MAIALTCTCGASYELKNQMAGKLLQCPTCGSQMRTPVATALLDGDPAFARNKFLLRQKHLSLNDKYYVWDEQGSTLLFVERPMHFLRNLASAGTVGIGLVAAMIVGIIALTQFMDHNGSIFLGGGLLLLALVIVAGAVILGIMVSAKRHVCFYRDDTKQVKVMDVLQDQKVALLVATFTVRDEAGQTIARLRKNFLYNFFRKQWECLSPTGEMICLVKEDSIILSLLRRLLGPMLGLLRANFIFMSSDGQTVIGEFNRKLTLLDRYVLDMSADRLQLLDRRIALAMGVMLDTAEKR